MNKELKNRFIGAVSILVTSLLTFLVSAYFSSFATKAELSTVALKLDKIISGLCIIDNRTCSLKKD